MSAIGMRACELEEARRFYEADDEQRWGRTSVPEITELINRLLMTAGRGRDTLVLELGCGRGAFRDLATRCRYVGLDLSGRVLSRHLGAVPAVQADMETIPIASGRVDLVFSLCALEHVLHPEKALAEVHRVLCPGGVALLAPAWFCRDWAAKALPVRTYAELRAADKVRKALIPLRNSIVWRSAFALPRRALREIWFRLRPQAWRLHYRRLRPNFSKYCYTDCDAFSSLDPHEVVLLFRQWGYEAAGARTVLERLSLRNAPLTLLKPATG